MEARSQLHPWAQDYLSRFDATPSPQGETTTSVEQQKGADQSSQSKKRQDNFQAHWKDAREKLFSDLGCVSAGVPTFQYNAATGTFQQGSLLVQGREDPGLGQIDHSEHETTPTLADVSLRSDVHTLRDLFDAATGSPDQRPLPCDSPDATAQFLRHLLPRVTSRAEANHGPEDKYDKRHNPSPSHVSSVLLMERVLLYALQAALKAGSQLQEKSPGVSHSASLDRSATYFADVLNSTVVQRTLRTLLWKRAADAQKELIRVATPHFRYFLSEEVQNADVSAHTETLLASLFALDARVFYRLGKPQGKSPPPLVLTSVDHGSFFRLYPSSQRDEPPGLAHSEVVRQLFVWLGRPHTDTLLVPSWVASDTPSKDSATAAKDGFWGALCDLAQLKIYVAYLLHVESVLRQAHITAERHAGANTPLGKGSLEHGQGQLADDDRSLACTAVLLEAVAVLQAPTTQLLTRRRHVPRFLKKYTLSLSTDTNDTPKDASAAAMPHDPRFFTSVQAFFSAFRRTLHRALPEVPNANAGQRLAEPSPSVCSDSATESAIASFRELHADDSVTTLICERVNPSVPWPVAIVVGPQRGAHPIRCCVSPQFIASVKASSSADLQKRLEALTKALGRHSTLVSVNHRQLYGNGAPMPHVRKALKAVFNSRKLKMVLRLK